MHIEAFIRSIEMLEEDVGIQMSALGNMADIKYHCDECKLSYITDGTTFRD